MDNTTLPLHLSHVQKSSSIINRSHTLLHSTALIALIYYRIASFFQTTKPSDLPTTFSCLLVFTGELILSFIWFLGQANRFRPITRTVFPERLPENVELPAVDVFICTADPSKEPTLEEKYENFKSRVTRIRQNSTIIVNRDHAAFVEVINDESIDEASQEDKAEEMPLLVYVSREKRPSLPHHFKAGALNVLVHTLSLSQHPTIYHLYQKVPVAMFPYIFSWPQIVQKFLPKKTLKMHRNGVPRYKRFFGTEYLTSFNISIQVRHLDLIGHQWTMRYIVDVRVS